MSTWTKGEPNASTWIATFADGRELSIKVWSEPNGERLIWFARVGEAAPSVASTELHAAVGAVPGNESVIALRRDGEPSLAQMRAALEVAEGALEFAGLSDCIDRQRAVSRAALVTVRAALGLPVSP